MPYGAEASIVETARTGTHIEDGVMLHGTAGARGAATRRSVQRIVCAAALVLCGACTPEQDIASAGPESWATVQAAGGGRVPVLYVPAEGFAYHDAEGNLTGVTVEVMRHFADWVRAEHGVELDVDFVAEEDWRTFYGRVRDAPTGVFGIGNVTITEARRSELQFSPPYLTNVAVLITHERVPEVRGESDVGVAFRGLNALAFEGTLHEERLRRLRDAYVPDASLVMAGSNDAIVDIVANGGYFAYIDAYNYWRALERGSPLRRHPALDDPAEEFGVIMPLVSDWAPVIDGFFRHGDGYRNTSQYRELLSRHLGELLAEALETARRAQADSSESDR